MCSKHNYEAVPVAVALPDVVVLMAAEDLVELGADRIGLNEDRLACAEAHRAAHMRFRALRHEDDNVPTTFEINESDRINYTDIMAYLGSPF